MASSANTTFGGQPSTRGVSPAAPAAPAEVVRFRRLSEEYQRQRNDHGGCEQRRRSTIVVRHPKLAIARSKIGGHTVPAR